MLTKHILYNQDSSRMNIASDSIQLIITSPMYPMIAMWDNIFGIDIDFDPYGAFNNQHQILAQVWQECIRVLQPGGFICINVGDAVRTINKTFALYANHAKVIEFFVSHGFVQFPGIIWKKPTNAPNKFMGSGCLPPHAYVTLEHEHILILKKPGKRVIEPLRRRESAYFWEERNQWFSDLWEIKGEKQTEDGRRTAAFPFEIPYRLINMFSVQDDWVLDPFMGTGTTNIAALVSKRNSIGYDTDKEAVESAMRRIERPDLPAFVNNRTLKRIHDHEGFIRDREIMGKEIKGGTHQEYGFKCTSKQENQMKFWWFDGIKVPAMLDYMAGYNAHYYPLNYKAPPENPWCEGP